MAIEIRASLDSPANRPGPLTSRALPLAAALLVLLAASCTAGSNHTAETTLLPLSQQIELRSDWLEQRHEGLLEMMRRHGVSMWIIVSQEFHPDPVAELVAPPIPYVGKRSTFIFTDTGDDGPDQGLRRVAVTGYADARLSRFFESPSEPAPLNEVLPALLEAHDPATIALSIDGRRGPTASLTKASHDVLIELLGERFRKRIISAENLVEEYVDTRLPDELSHYRTAVELTAEIGRRAFSSEVIRPGQTTVAEIRAWILDQMWAHSVQPWFSPDIRVQRNGHANPTSRGFLATAPDDMVIEVGDLLHLDIGFEYLGLATDWQKMAYVLRPGETDAPQGLRDALAGTSYLQDELCQISRPGKTAGEVYEATMAAMERRGITAQIYSHPLNRFGHGLGTTIDFRSSRRDDAEERLAKPLRLGSYMAIELNTAAEIPEWDGQKVWIMEEDPAHLTDQGWVFFVPRQTSFYLVGSAHEPSAR